MLKTYGFGKSSFDIRRFGFGFGFGFGLSDAPKLTANFVTGEYKQDGSVSGFAELFSFSRAGKAWLVKDIGLQEYAADSPRFDAGLLIEQSATNFVRASKDFPVEKNSFWALFAVESAAISDGSVITVVQNSNYHRIYSESRSVPQFNHTRSQTLLIKDVQTRYIGFCPSDGLSANSGLAIDTSDLSYVYSNSADQTIIAASIRIKRVGTSILVNYLVEDTGAWNNTATTVMSLQFLKSKELTTLSRRYTPSGVEKLTVLAIDSKIENNTSSIIPTLGTPVTRPADFLTSKILGTTVTGDWDSTLTLSIVNGQLVHSGYGKIRTLEIN